MRAASCTGRSYIAIFCCLCRRTNHKLKESSFFTNQPMRISPLCERPNRNQVTGRLHRAIIYHCRWLLAYTYLVYRSCNRTWSVITHTEACKIQACRLEHSSKCCLELWTTILKYWHIPTYLLPHWVMDSNIQHPTSILLLFKSCVNQIACYISTMRNSWFGAMAAAGN